MIFRVCFLFDESNDWIKKHFDNQFSNNSKYNYNSTTDFNKAVDNDIVFVIGYTKILDKEFLKVMPVILRILPLNSSRS